MNEQTPESRMPLSRESGMDFETAFVALKGEIISLTADAPHDAGLLHRLLLIRRKLEASLDKDARIVELERELSIQKACNVKECEPAPCGHPSYLSHSEDGGKHIRCYACQVQRAAEAERVLREAAPTLHCLEAWASAQENSEGRKCTLGQIQRVARSLLDAALRGEKG